MLPSRRESPVPAVAAARPHAQSSTSDSYTAYSTRRWIAILFAFLTVTGFLHFVYRSLADLASGGRVVFLARFIDEMTSAYCAGLLFVLLLPFIRKYRLTKQTWVRRLPVHLLATVAFSAALTTLRYITRSAIFPLVGLGVYDY